MEREFENSYRKLLVLSRKTSLLRSIEAHLAWDQETYLPSASIDLRSEQLTLLADITHNYAISAQFKKNLANLIDLTSGLFRSSNCTKEEAANLREWRRDYLKAVNLPGAFVRKFATTTSQALHAWQEAKKSNQFALFLPHLERIIQLNRKKAKLLGFHEHPYDALLDLYEPEMTVAQLTPLFTQLKISLKQLVKELQSQPLPPSDFLFLSYAPDQQMRIFHALLEQMGFTSDRSRLDISTHPFCTGTPFDLRMTTSMHRENFMANFFAVLHEGGHGLYCLGRPLAHFGEPLSESASLGVEESQSRFWETIIGHSLPFWRNFYPKLQKEFPEQLGNVTLSSFYRAIHQVRPSYIRIHADEVTYTLHILVRFEIEKAFIEGTLSAKELPEAWNAAMEEYLGITPRKDCEGCLQDIHWAMGAMGYFPTYTLGNLYAAQLFETMQNSFPDWEERLNTGDLSFLCQWLKGEIHQYGRCYSPQELMRKTTGQQLSALPYLRYLEEKYRGLNRE
jgi:carboxypeptidase Taq